MEQVLALAKLAQRTLLNPAPAVTLPTPGGGGASPLDSSASSTFSSFTEVGGEGGASLEAAERMRSLVNARRAAAELLASVDDKYNEQLTLWTDAVKSDVAKMKQEGAQRDASLAEEETRLEHMREKLQRLEMARNVTLNVGGQVFRTTRATLTEGGAAGSMLAALISERWGNGDNDDNEVFIDRSPALFTYILDWLRSGSVQCLPDASRLGLIKEADYYGLTRLIDCLKGWRHREMALSEENKEILDTENKVRKLLVAANPTGGTLESLQTLADSLLIDVFAEKNSFVLDIAPSESEDDLTLLVDRRCDTNGRVRQAFEELQKPNPTKFSSVCNSVVEYTAVNFKFFTLDALRDLDWSGVLVAGGAVLGSLLPLPDAVYSKCFPRGIPSVVDTSTFFVGNGEEE